MDSIITQVTPEQAARDAEAASSSQYFSNRNSVTNTTNASSTTERRNKGFFTQLCCCCGSLWRGSRKKKQPVVDEVHNEELVAANNVNNVTEDQVVKANNPPPGGYLLQPCLPHDTQKPCMVIDLDETLVHSSFKPIGNADFIVPVEIDGVVHQVYVAKRPYVDEFLQKMGELYECILFTASLAKYADPVADLLDKWGVFRTRLFRDSCVFHRGNYVKDLNKLGRSLHRVVIVDNSPASYIFHPDNAVPVASWFDDTSDTELLYLIPFFERLATVDNVYTVLRNSNHPFNTPPNVAKELLP